MIRALEKNDFGPNMVHKFIKNAKVQTLKSRKFGPEMLGKTGFESGKHRQASGKTTRFRGKLLLSRFFGSGISNIFARNAWQDRAPSTPCILLRGRI